jgi:hypothetical protein
MFVAVEVPGGLMRQSADHFPGRRVVHIVLAAAAAGDEFPIDVQGQAFVHVASVLTNGCFTRMLETRDGARDNRASPLYLT